MEKEKTPAAVVTHMGLGDHFTANGLVRAIAEKHSPVLVATRGANNARNVRKMYSDNESIQVVELPNREAISRWLRTQRRRPDVRVYCCGSWAGSRRRINIPYSFYADAGVDGRAFWERSFFPITDETLQPPDMPYVFVHRESSVGIRFTLESIADWIGDKEQRLVVNPCRNEYPVGHRFHDIAQRFVMKPVVDYHKVITNADVIWLTGSSFFCFAIQLPIVTEHCYTCSDYSTIWTQYGMEPKFKHVRIARYRRADPT